MLKKRIIPCLDIQDGRTVKGVNFKEIRDAGNPVDLARRYSEEGADELVFLDITATIEKRKTLLEFVEKVAKVVNIPFTVGGGINSIENVAELLNAGADKISLNSYAVKNPELLTEIANWYGSQCLVVAIDTKFLRNTWKVFVGGGQIETIWKTLDWAKRVVELGAGEILLTSMNSDGTKSGYAIDITKTVSETVNVPVIASGGAGKMEDFEVLFNSTRATGGLAASIFHYREISIYELKNYLRKRKIPIR